MFYNVPIVLLYPRGAKFLRGGNPTLQVEELQDGWPKCL